MIFFLHLWHPIGRSGEFAGVGEDSRVYFLSDTDGFRTRRTTVGDEAAALGKKLHLLHA